MKLPGGAYSIVEISKLRDYSLDPHHPRGRHKARIPGEVDQYGARYTIDLQVGH